MYFCLQALISPEEEAPSKKGLLAHLLRERSPQNLPPFAQVSLWSKGAILLIFRTVKVS